ncbi:MAG: energy transducer TonB [Bacteroidota bacterium]
MRSTALPLAFCLLTFLPGLAQDTPGMPTYQGGEQALWKKLQTNLVYPAYARNNCITGIARVAFIVTQDGAMDSVQVVGQVGGGCDEEALRVVKLLDGNWLPGKIEGQPVRARYVLPIRFALPNSNCDTKEGRARAASAKSAYNPADVPAQPKPRPPGTTAFEKGVERFYAKDYTAALAHFDEAHTSNPKNPVVLYNRGLVKMQLKDMTGACKDWEKAGAMGDRQARETYAQQCK